MAFTFPSSIMLIYLLAENFKQNYCLVLRHVVNKRY